jgi:hypothetical protein
VGHGHLDEHEHDAECVARQHQFQAYAQAQPEPEDEDEDEETWYDDDDDDDEEEEEEGEPKAPEWCIQGVFVKQGSKVGEITMAPDSDLDVQVCWSDGTESGYIKAAELARASSADQCNAASWCTQGTRAKFQGKIGTLEMSPDSDAEVKLKYNDGSVSGYIKAVRVHPLSAEEVAAEKCWYVAQGSVGQEVGPYTIEQMKEYITNGVITYDRKIRHKQNDELVEAYRYARQFPELVEQQQLQQQLQQQQEQLQQQQVQQLQQQLVGLLVADALSSTNCSDGSHICRPSCKYQHCCKYCGKDLPKHEQRRCRKRSSGKMCKY